MKDRCKRKKKLNTTSQTEKVAGIQKQFIGCVGNISDY